MSEKREHHSRRQASGPAAWWRQHRAWVAGLSRGQKIRYRLFQALAVAAVLVIAACLALRAWIRLPDVPELPVENQPSASQEGDGMDFEGAELPEVAKSGRRPGVYTFLLAGQDTAGGGNTDTIILFTFDTQNKTLHGMSLPRDTMVNGRHSGAGHRLNAVYNYNKGSDPDTQVEKGMAALKSEVSKLTGIVPDFYVVVQWEAVGQMVDAIGGVWFEVPFDMNYDDPTPGQDLHIHQEAGYRLLSGDDAMQVIRWRKNNNEPSGGDVARIPIQQDFLKAAISQCLKPETLLKAPSLAQIFMENVDTDLSVGNILAFAQLAAGMDTENNVNFVTMPWVDARYPGVSMVLPAVDELVEALNGGLNPYQEDIQASDLSVLYRNSNGSYSVTGGTLLDESLSRPRGSSSSSGSGQSSGGAAEEPVTETPDGSQTAEPGGETQVPDGSQAGEIPDGSQPQTGTGETEDPDGSQTGTGETEVPDGSQTQTGTGETEIPDGSQTQAPSGETGEAPPEVPAENAGDVSVSNPAGEGGQPPESEAPPSQDIGGGDNLTVTELPDWLNPTGAEPAA